LTGDSFYILVCFLFISTLRKSSASADSAIPKFVFFTTPKLGLAKEFVYFARMMVGFYEFMTGLPRLVGLICGLEIAEAVTLPSN